MGVTFDQIASDEAQIDVPYGQHTIHVTYYPSKVTEETLAATVNFESAKDGASVLSSFKSLNDALVDLIKSWDIFEDTDETVMYPLDADKLAKLPIKLRMGILTATLRDISPEATAPQMPNS